MTTASRVIFHRFSPLKIIPQITLFVLLSISLANGQSTGQPQEDADIRPKIVGTWIVDLHSTNNTIEGTETINADGTMVGKAKMIRNQTEQEIDYEATWKVSNGFYMTTVTKSFTPLIKVGTTTRDKVILVDDEKLVLRKANGKTSVRKRRK